MNKWTKRGPYWETIERGKRVIIGTQRWLGIVWYKWGVDGRTNVCRTLDEAKAEALNEARRMEHGE
jgi:hypothetical protein